ncbi:hypothetical protein ACR0SW_20740 [Blautia wexlerae]|uniref:hypothetical protein n=1 Tax=Blautia wexlerae TaxID=418240 RepID=UPI003D989CD6
MEINNEILHSSSLLPDSIHVLLSNHVFRVLLILWVLGIVLRGMILILTKLMESDDQRKVDGENSADYNDQYKNTENYATSYYAPGEIDKALRYYHLNIPFSQEELRNRRRFLMKSAHPDSGGSTEEAEKINRYYDVLKELLQ